MNLRFSAPNSICGAVLTTLLAAVTLLLTAMAAPPAPATDSLETRGIAVLTSSTSLPMVVIGVPAWLLEKLAR